MRRKFLYIIGGIVLAAATLFYLHKTTGWIDGDELNYVSATIALIISIIALGIADWKSFNFRGTVKVWNTKKIDQNFPTIAFEIINYSKRSITDVSVTFFIPKKIVAASALEDVVIESGEKLVFQRFFPSISMPNRSTFRMTFPLDFANWKKGDIEIIIAGSNIVEFELKLNQRYGKDVIETSQNGNPLYFRTWNKNWRWGNTQKIS